MNRNRKSSEKALELETGQLRLVSNWGGRREGAGRKGTLPPAKGGRKSVAFYLSADEEELLRETLAEYRKQGNAKNRKERGA